MPSFVLFFLLDYERVKSGCKSYCFLKMLPHRDFFKVVVVAAGTAGTAGTGGTTEDEERVSVAEAPTVARLDRLGVGGGVGNCCF